MTRTHQKHWRTYVNGVDLSGYSRQIGALSTVFDAEQDAALTDGVKNVLIGHGDIQAGPLNAFLDNDTAGLFANQAQGTRIYSAVMGANAAPANGDLCFTWAFEDSGYLAEQGTGFVAASLPFGGASYSGTLSYKRPWGVVIHAKGAETAVNTATGVDDNAASSALGGIFVYHLFSSDGTLTIKAQDAATNSNGSFSDLSGATSGSITAAVSPKYGMVALSTTATVRRYLRWQIVLGTATTATFFAAFIRNSIP